MNYTLEKGYDSEENDAIPKAGCHTDCCVLMKNRQESRALPKWSHRVQGLSGEITTVRVPSTLSELYSGGKSLTQLFEGGIEPVEVFWSQRGPGSEVDAVRFLFNAGSHLLTRCGQGQVFSFSQDVPSLSECRDSLENVLRTLSVLQSASQLRQ